MLRGRHSRLARGGIADAISGSGHRQPVDVRAALRLVDSRGNGGGQRLVRPAAEHRRGWSHGAPTVRGRRSIPNDVWGSGMGGRLDGESSQHSTSQEAAIRIVRGYRTVSHASATALAASPPWELWALVLKKRYARARLFLILFL